MDRFEPTWLQHWPDLGSTSACKAPTSAQLAQLGSKMAQLGPNLDPFGSNFCPSWSLPASKWGRSRPNEILKTPVFTGIFHVFLLSMTLRLEQCSHKFPMLCLREPNLVRSCRQKVPSCRMLELTWMSMCMRWLQFGVHLDRFWPNFSQTWPTGANLGCSWARPGAAKRLEYHKTYKTIWIDTQLEPQRVSKIQKWRVPSSKTNWCQIHFLGFLFLLSHHSPTQHQV